MLKFPEFPCFTDAVTLQMFIFCNLLVIFEWTEWTILARCKSQIINIANVVRSTVQLYLYKRIISI